MRRLIIPALLVSALLGCGGNSGITETIRVILDVPPDVTAFDIFRDNVQIGTVVAPAQAPTTTSVTVTYADKKPPAGAHSYYATAVNAEGVTKSNVVTVVVP